MGAREAPTVSWPSELLDVFEQAITCEYASLTRAGTPVTIPTTPYVGAGGTLDVSTGLTYPAKAERARRNPKVALLFADPIGTPAGNAPVVLVQGYAAVRDADLQSNTDRYARDSVLKLPAAVAGQPRALLRRMVFYYARIWIEVTPIQICWWPDRSLTAEPHVWQADPDHKPPKSDPAPPGRQPSAWLDPPRQWREIAQRALRTLPFADLTVVARDGFPISVPVLPGAMDGDEIPLRVGPYAPELPTGPACLTVHGHDERFTTQENHALIGELVSAGDGVRLRAERALADWSLIGNRLQRTVGFLLKGRRLGPRLKAESARRGQPVPTVNLP